MDGGVVFGKAAHYVSFDAVKTCQHKENKTTLKWQNVVYFYEKFWNVF